MTVSPLLALIASSLFAAVGQVILKIGASAATEPGHFLNLRIAAGLTAYGLSTVLWIWALSRVPLNIAYGFTALTFLLVFAASGLVLKEIFSLWTYIGLGLVLAGFLCLTVPTR